MQADSNHGEAEDGGREKSPTVNTKMDLGKDLQGEKWAQSPETVTSSAKNGSES